MTDSNTQQNQESNTKKLAKRSSKSGRIWVESDLKKLDEYAPADRYQSIDSQAELMKWEICMYLSDLFHKKSKKEMGAFLVELQRLNPEHPLCLIGQQQINRYSNAARFLKKYNIKDYSKIGLKRVQLYELSRKKNIPIAGAILMDFKDKKITNNDIIPAIQEAWNEIERSKAITVQPMQEPLSIEHKEPIEKRFVPVVNNVAIEPEIDKADVEVKRFDYPKPAIRNADHEAYVEDNFDDDLRDLDVFLDEHERSHPKSNIAMMKAFRDRLNERINNASIAMHPKR